MSENRTYLFELNKNDFVKLAKSRKDQMKEILEMYSIGTSNKTHLNGEQTSNRMKELSGRIEVFEQLIAEAELLGDSVLYFKESTGNLVYFMLDKEEIGKYKDRKKELKVAYV